MRIDEALLGGDPSSPDFHIGTGAHKATAQFTPIRRKILQPLREGRAAVPPMAAPLDASQTGAPDQFHFMT